MAILLFSRRRVQGRLRFYEVGGVNFTSFEAQLQATNIAYVLPAAQGATNTFLRNSGSGVLSWASASAAAVTSPVFFANELDGNEELYVPAVPVTMHIQLQDRNTGDQHTQMLLLAGRTGATNDPTISTTATGTIYGSTNAAGNLVLQSTSNPTRGTVDVIAGGLRVRTSGTAITGATTNVVELFQANATSTVASLQLRLINTSPTITLDEDMTAFLGWRMNHIWTSVAAESHALGTHTGINYAPTFSAVASNSLTGLVNRAEP
jgi:hypothetical protein